MNYKIPDNLKKHIYFVIPVFNESKVIEKVIKNLQNNGYNNLVLIDDGSTDNSSNIILKYKKPGLVLLKHIINRGQGAALATGFEFCKLQKECKYVVTFDSDGQHRLSDLYKFIEKLEKNSELEVILGSRFLNKKTEKLVPLKKQVVLKLGLIVTFVLSNIWLTDTHNGYRVFKRETLDKIEINMDGFEHASEIIDEISRKKIKYSEVPVFIDYNDYSKAKGQKISNSIRIVLKMLFR